MPIHDRKVEITVKEQYLLPLNVHESEFGKTYAMASQDRDDEAEKSGRARDIFVTADDEHIIIEFERAARRDDFEGLRS